MKLIPIENWSEIDPSGVCISLASKSKCRFKLGAFICDKKGRVVVSASNSTKTHPEYGSKPPFKTLHAEGNCLWAAHKLGIMVKGFTMFVFRDNSNLSKPCIYCQTLLKKHGIVKVYYSVKSI